MRPRKFLMACGPSEVIAIRLMKSIEMDVRLPIPDRNNLERITSARVNKKKQPPPR